MEKRKYVELRVEILSLMAEDILTASEGFDGEWDDLSL